MAMFLIFSGGEIPPFFLKSIYKKPSIVGPKYDLPAFTYPSSLILYASEFFIYSV